MRRTLTMAAATAALALVGGPLVVTEAHGAPVLGRWSAVEAQAFWTPERMAAAIPAPPEPEAPEVADPSPGPAASPADPAPSATPTPTPTPPPTPTPSPSPSVAAVPPGRAPDPAYAAAAAHPGVGRDFDGMPVVGRMFVMTGGGGYFCTASVVSSPGRDLVVSAAHCLLGADARQVAFVPHYRADRPQPYGMFPVLRDSAGHAKVWIAPRYRSEGADRAATLDVAFAQVGPNASGALVEDVVGGNRLVTGAAYAQASVTLVGYPASAARPRLCVNRTTKFTSSDPKIPGTFQRIDCTGYPGGTSGGPFLTHFDPNTLTGDIVGVIGGWKTGGDTDDTSYSSYFGAEIRALYETAVASARVARVARATRTTRTG
ncbi:hypothetical protein [Streptomyces sp. A1136]|uniref:hypothetical protein n=1 Tax=Streptomyces sp. A1136 TaxID=2563102 RepID=UPI001444FB66|nr:hypothetical protein [Streptomyces sp. A1136]